MKRIGQSAVTTGSGTLLYTVPTGYKTQVADISIANTGSSDITCAIHIVSHGGSASSSNTFFPTVTIPQKTLIQWTGSMMMNAGDFIQAIAGASGITVTVNGEEMRVSA